jgi:histidinol-phosphate aminotransferase
MIRIRRHLEGLAPCLHGSLSERERRERGSEREIIDFSASCNPLGSAPGVLEAIAGVRADRYPDDDATELRGALATRLGLGAEWIAAGNGSVELLWHLATAFLDPRDPVLIVGPVFGEYERACRVAGARVEIVAAREGDCFAPPVEAAVEVISRLRPRLAFLCNPNNPTGQLLPAEAVESLLEACVETLLVVDEAYLPFCDSPPDLLPLLSSGRLLLLRSMTKDHGLAGLRLGYSVAPPEITGALSRVRPPWNVNAAAQAAGLAALEDDEHVRRGREVAAEARRYLQRELGSLGLQVVPSAANFILVRAGNGAAFRSSLMERGVCLRDCASFGLPAHVRIGVRTLPKCRRLVEAVAEVVSGA